MSSYQWPITKPTFFDLAVYCIPLRFGNSAWDFWGAKSWSRDFFGFCWKKKNVFPLYCFHISRFHSVTSNSKPFSPAATLDPRPQHWTHDRDIGPATAPLDRDRDIGPLTATLEKFQTQKSLLRIRLWAITFLPIKRARCLPQINAIKFLGNLAEKFFERQTKATLEVKTRLFVSTFEGG